MSEYDLNNPQSDVESYLANMDGILAPLPLPPESNVEKYLAHIVGVQGVELPNKPDSRVEAYLEKLALDPPQPVTPILIEKQITNNGVYSAGDDNADGYSKVTVDIPDPVLDELVATVNGEYNPTHDGYSKVTVQVPDPALETLSVTENGEYTPTAYGYSRVTVSVQPPENSYQLKSITTPTPLATFEASAMPMPSLKVSVEAKQDLHGYDKPWVGGAGKNKLNPAIIEDGYTINEQGELITTTHRCATTTEIDVTSFNSVTVSYTSTVSGTKFIYATFNGSTLVERYVNKVSGDTIDTTGATKLYISWYSGSGDVLVANLSNLQVEVGSTATSYEPYSNICPISGWDETNVSDVGKNLANVQKTNTAPSINTGEDVPFNSWTTDYIKVDTNVSYTLSVQQIGARCVLFYTNNKTYLGYMGTFPPDGLVLNTYTRWSEVGYVRLRFDTETTAQLEVGTSATAYEPYNPNSYTTTIALGQTVYGGELDVVNGTSGNKITYGMVDLGTLTWSRVGTLTSGKYRYSATCSPTPKATSSNTDTPDIVCSNYEAVTPSNTYNCITGVTVTTNSAIIIYDDNLSDVSVEDFKAAMSGVQLVYKLATPTTLTTQPTPIKSLNGTNNLSVDSGEVLEGEYFKAL